MLSYMEIVAEPLKYSNAAPLGRTTVAGPAGVITISMYSVTCVATRAVYVSTTSFDVFAV